VNEDAYIEDLRRRLSFRGASRRQVKDIVAEVRSHLADSGEDPVDAFGQPDEYAKSVLRGYRWPTARVLVLLVCSIPGASLVTRSVGRLWGGEEVVSVQASELLFWVVMVLVTPLSLAPLVHRWLAGRPSLRLVGLLGVGLAGGGASYLGSSVFGDRPMVTLEPWPALAVGVGLLAATALIVLLWRHLRRPAARVPSTAE
jgi:HAAS domain-containing protein